MNIPMDVVHVEVVFSLSKRMRVCDGAYMRECTCILACVRDHICDFCMCVCIRVMIQAQNSFFRRF